MIGAVVAECDGLIRAIAECALRSADAVTVATVTTANEMVDACRATNADVVVTAPRLDVPVHPLVPDLLAAGRHVLLLSGDLDDTAVIAALVAGASGCLSVRDIDPAELVAATLATASGKAVLHHDIAVAILEQWRDMRQRPSHRHDAVQLTRREQQVLSAVAEGLTTVAIGHRLGIAAKTVEAHKTRIFGKLGARDQAHAVTVALRRGVLAPPMTERPAPTRVGRSSAHDAGPLT